MIYWEIVKFRFARFFAYPFEIVAGIIERGLEITFLIIYWTLVTKAGGGDTQREIISYFLIAAGISDLVMAKWEYLGKYLAHGIKTGKMNVFLTKPVNIIFTYWASAIGNNGVKVILAIVFVSAGLIINPPSSLLAIILALYFLIWAILISFSYNLLVAIMYFHLTEASGFKNSIDHMTRILNGRFVPINYFPIGIQKYVRLSPFPFMVFSATNALTTDYINQQVINDIGIAIFWGLGLPLISYLAWKASIKKYEAIGI